MEDSKEIKEGKPAQIQAEELIKNFPEINDGNKKKSKLVLTGE